MTPELSTRVYTELQTVSDLRSEWDRLVACSRTATIFSTPEWLVAWWNAFGADTEPYLVAFFDGPSLVGFAPLARTQIVNTGGFKHVLLRFLGDGSEDSDNLDFPVLPGRETEVAMSLLLHLRAASPQWDVCKLNTLPCDSAVGVRLQQALSEQNWVCHVYPRACSAIDFPESWEAFLQKMKERTNLRYYTRRLEKAHRVNFYRCEDERALGACLETFFELHNRRWRELRSQAGTFASPERRRFYHEMASGFLRRGWLEFYLLDLDGKTVAADLNFRYRNTAFSLQSGFDPDYADLRVGFVLKGYVLRALIQQGVRRYDFLGGLDPNKSRWGAEAANYTDLHFARPFSPGSVYLNLRHQALQARNYLRERLPQPVWSLLKRGFHLVR